jgi:hypothetical protein
MTELTPTAAELTAIRPGSDPLWIMSTCCHVPHHAGDPCPGCGRETTAGDLQAELVKRHGMLVKAGELINRLRPELATESNAIEAEEQPADDLSPGGRQSLAAMNAHVYAMSEQDRERWYAEHPASSFARG